MEGTKYNSQGSAIPLKQEKESSFDEGEKEWTGERGKVVITGGTEGIGKEIAEEFLIRNANRVAICARTKKKLDEMQQYHLELFAERVDLSDRHATKTFAQEAIKDLGGLDALILNAAIFDFDFKEKSTGSSEDGVSKKMFQANEVANVTLIRASKEALQKACGTIVFLTTRFGVVKDIETASVVDSQSAAAQEDIGNYIRDKRRINKYLNDFIKDESNAGIFVFSVIPGTVNTRANRKLIEVGTHEMSAAKIKEREERRERDPRLVGRIIAKMTATRKKFNQETQQYDIDIENGGIVEISNAAIEFEKEQRKLNPSERDTGRHHLVHAGNVLGRDISMYDVSNAHEIVDTFPLYNMEAWPQDKKIIDSGRDVLIEKIKWYYGKDISQLTFGQLVRGIKSIMTDFDVNEDLIRITRDELWLRSKTGHGTQGIVVQ